MSTSKLKALFNGCSVTVGAGFPEDLRDTYVYDRLICNHFNFDRTNIAVEASSNYKIFIRTCEALISKKYDLVVTQWAPFPRFWFSPEPGTHLYIDGVSDRTDDFVCTNLWVSKKEMSDFANLLRILSHDYQSIIELIDYCCIIDALGEATNTPVVYINGNTRWENDLVKPLEEDLEKSLSDFSKSMLNFAHKPDQEIILNFTALQEKFAKLKQSNWVNLFDCFKKSLVDVGPLGHHPGEKTYQLLADQVINHLNKNL
jgi:hypothetical protein